MTNGVKRKSHQPKMLWRNIIVPSLVFSDEQENWRNFTFICFSTIWNFEILTKHVSFYRTKVRIILWRSEMQITQNCLIRWFAEPSELCPVFFNDEEQQRNWFKKFETYERRNPNKNIDICVESSLIISHWNVK